MLNFAAIGYDPKMNEFSLVDRVKKRVRIRYEDLYSIMDMLIGQVKKNDKDKINHLYLQEF